MIVKLLALFCCIIASFLVSSCVETVQHYAPVVDAEQIESIPSVGTHKTTSGETLYSIAWRYGLDYRSLAVRNHLKAPYYIQAGQLIYLKGRMPYQSRQVISQSHHIVLPVSSVSSVASVSVIRQTKKHRVVSRPPVEREPIAAVTLWQWPARGMVIGAFSDLNRGVNIAGHRGDPIYASAPGKVVYSGDGLRGYGNLIIIKHNESYLTAYAHNKVVYVKSGSWVQAGQRIAAMGETSSKQAMLHFEIRHNGKPVNPLTFLERSS